MQTAEFSVSGTQPAGHDCGGPNAAVVLQQQHGVEGQSGCACCQMSSLFGPIAPGLSAMILQAMHIIGRTQPEPSSTEASFYHHRAPCFHN